MSIITQIYNSQQKKLQYHANNLNSSDFVDLLSSDTLTATIKEHVPQFREQIYTPTQTLSMFVAQALNEDRSCSKAVIDMIIQNQSNNKVRKISPNTGAYCLARQKLPLSLLTNLTTKIAELVHEKSTKQWGWNNRPVRLIDGTTLTMPDTVKNQAEFPQQAGQKEGLGFPICRLLAVSCLSSGVILNAAISPFKGKGSDEQSLLREVLDTFKHGDVVLGDAFFGTYFLLAEMKQRGVDVLFEQLGARKRKIDFGSGIALGKKDHLIEIPKSKKKPDWMTQEQFNDAPDKILIREIKVGKKVLITSMLSAKKYPKKELNTLYKQRWHVEVDFRNIKTTLGMNILSCKTPDMCKKEIWVYLLANNLLRLLMAQAAFEYNLKPRQLSFKYAIQIWNTYYLLGKILDEEMFSLIVKRVVGNRPGRIEPRAVKRRPKPYKLLMIPRNEARLDIMKNGHPKKIK
jgi:Transposase DDE domain